MHAAQSTEDLKRKTQQAGQEVKETVSETGQVFKSSVAQLLGVRGGEQTADKWKIRLQLTKPVTWVPLIWGARQRLPLCSICTAPTPATAQTCMCMCCAVFGRDLHQCTGLCLGTTFTCTEHQAAPCMCAGFRRDIL